MTTVLRYAKAVAAGLVAGAAAAAGMASADGHLTLVGWLVVAAAALTGSGVVAVTPNKPPA
jgi:preprotein translocase subunit SecA